MKNDFFDRVDRFKQSLIVEAYMATRYKTVGNYVKTQEGFNGKASGKVYGVVLQRLPELHKATWSNPQKCYQGDLVNLDPQQ